MVEEPPAEPSALLAAERDPDAALRRDPRGELDGAFRNGFDNILRVESGRKPKWVIDELADLVK